jgi:hypothetical protein
MIRHPKAASLHSEKDLRSDRGSQSRLKLGVVKGSAPMFSGWTLSDEIAAITSGAAGLQFIALILTVGVMIRNGRRQLRAYVNVTKVTGWNDGRHTFTIEIKNYGQTPAYHMRTDCAVVLTDYPLVQELMLPANPTFTGPCIAAPGAESHIVIEVEPLFPDDELDRVLDGKKAIFIFGKITYIDAFNSHRWTLFRHMLGGDAFLKQSGNCAHAREGNDAN